MNLFRKLSLSLALLFFGLSSVIVLLDIIGDYYILINNFSSNQILAILSSISVVFFLCYLFLEKKGRIYRVVSMVLLVLTCAILVFTGFAPKYRYTEIVSEDKKHTIVVEEKTTGSSTYIRAYEEITKPIYHSIYAITLNKKKFGDSYQYGDFDIVLREKSYKISVPLYSKSYSIVPYHKKGKTSD